MSKPSILMINRVYPPTRGATGRMMQDLGRALTENGWRVTVVSCAQQKSEKVPKSINHQLVRSRFKAKGAFSYGWILFLLLLKGLRQPKHDVVLTMTDPPSLVSVGRIIAGFKRSKHVHWCQDLYPDLFPALNISMPKFILRRIEKSMARSYKKLAHMVVIGACMGERMVQKDVLAEKITFIPNWADFEVISPSTGGMYSQLPEKISAMAKKPEEMFRDESPKFRVLYAGTIGRAHPIKLIVEAAEQLAEHKEIEFVFVGDKFAHSRLAEERVKRGLENIRFMPFQPIEKLRSVMEGGDIHLVTMREEAAGLLVPCKFYSGLTVGRPTIFAGPKNSEISDVITNYKCGSIVAPTDGTALAEAIYNYRTNGDEWFEAQQGALQAAQAYHPSQSLNHWVNLLEEIQQS